MILHHQIEKVFGPPLFRFAVFIGGTLPFSRSPDIGWDFTEHYGQIDLKRYLYEQAIVKPKSENPIKSRSFEEYENTSDEEMRDDSCRVFLPTIVYPYTDIDRIQIPTVHIYGSRDGWKSQNLQLVDLCEPDLRETVEHADGHEIPMQQELGLKISAMIRNAAARSETLA